MTPITLETLSSPGCHVCKLFEEFWRSIEKEWPNVAYRNVQVVTPEGQEMAHQYMILTSPGIILNGTLWASGGFDKEKFVARLKELSE